MGELFRYAGVPLGGFSRLCKVGPRHLARYGLPWDLPESGVIVGEIGMMTSDLSNEITAKLGDSWGYRARCPQLDVLPG
ncbi:hypothetical protein ACS0TY_011547 [Phlomoides rotata]